MSIVGGRGFRVVTLAATSTLLAALLLCGSTVASDAKDDSPRDFSPVSVRCTVQGEGDLVVTFEDSSKSYTAAVYVTYRQTQAERVRFFSGEDQNSLKLKLDADLTRALLREDLLKNAVGAAKRAVAVMRDACSANGRVLAEYQSTLRKNRRFVLENRRKN